MENFYTQVEVKEIVQIRVNSLKLALWCLVVGALLWLTCGCSVLDAEYTFSNDSELIGAASLWEDWEKTTVATNQELVSIEECIEDKSKCERYMHSVRLLVIRARARDLEPIQKMNLVNQYVNRTVRKYSRDPRVVQRKEDKKVVVRQHWSTLFEFLRRGGDCEDFATAKYALLKLLDFDPNNLRVVVVYDYDALSHHAVIAVHMEDDRVALMDIDNKIHFSRPISYKFVYSINEHSIWDHGLNE